MLSRFMLSEIIRTTVDLSFLAIEGISLFADLCAKARSFPYDAQLSFVFFTDPAKLDQKIRGFILLHGLLMYETADIKMMMDKAISSIFETFVLFLAPFKDNQRATPAEISKIMLDPLKSRMCVEI